MKKSLVFLALAMATPALAQPAAQTDAFEFSGYWRAGFNTGANPLQRPDDENGQGGINAPTSRHIRNPNYFRFTLGRKFTNGMRVEAGIDSPDDKNLPHANGLWKTDSLRVRDLYLVLPIDESTKIWAGSRRIEPEDVRIFDIFPFGLTTAFGGGLETSWGQVILSATDSSVDYKTLDNKSKRKTLTAMVRGEISMSETSKLKPTLIVTARGKDPEHTVTNPDVPSIQPDPAPTPATVDIPERKASGDVKVGAVYSYWGDDHWANNFLVISTNAEDVGEDTGHDITYALYQSGSFALSSDAAILTALSFELTNFHTTRSSYKLSNGAIVPDEDGDSGTKKIHSKSTLSVGFQPVYFVTEKFHAGVDLNLVQHFKKVSANDANAIFVTPIVRYAMNKNALGTPQIYTSVTYGSYEAKIKSKFDGAEKQDKLFTTQTGFEVWF